MPARAPLAGDVIGVLVVEDEPLALMDAADAFTEAGLAVFEVRNADEAVGILARHDDIRVLITDLDMSVGALNGGDLVQLVTARWPDIGIVVFSGASAAQRGPLPAGVRFLPKPGSPRGLVSEAFAIVSRQTGSV